MIIHSIVPPEMIFPPAEDGFGSQTHMEWNGVPLLVEPLGSRCRVIRILSSQPADYLNENIQPGSYLTMTMPGE